MSLQVLLLEAIYHIKVLPFCRAKHTSGPCMPVFPRYRTTAMSQFGPCMPVLYRTPAMSQFGGVRKSVRMSSILQSETPQRPTSEPVESTDLYEVYLL